MHCITEFFVIFISSETAEFISFCIEEKVIEMSNGIFFVALNIDNAINRSIDFFGEHVFNQHNDTLFLYD